MQINMTYCHSCGTAVTRDAVFCGGCGKRIEFSPVVGTCCGITYQVSGKACAYCVQCGLSLRLFL